MTNANKTIGGVPRPNYIPEPLCDTLRRYCNVNAFTDHWSVGLKRWVADLRFAEETAKFKRQLADAILYGTITPEAYECVTGQDFDTQADLTKWLCELWQEIYGDEEIK